MVTFKNAGRFGNWFMQACTCISYALKHDLDFSFPARTDNAKWNPVYCLHLASPYQKWVIDGQHVYLMEDRHEYLELPFQEEWRVNHHIEIHGYRQSEKYFKEHRYEILHLLNFPYEKKKGYVGLHLRFGDYEQLRNKHPLVTKEYYEKAMGMFPDYKFKVFSDEIEKAKIFLEGIDGLEYSTNTDEVSDAVELSCCEHQICSASTFSWAAMWMNRNENKVVVFPYFWFTPGWCGLNTDDIVPEWCIKLKV